MSNQINSCPFLFTLFCANCYVVANKNMADNKIVVSIIIATYNSEKTLNVALDSVLKQEYQDWECIVVDGASKDKTIDIIKAYVEKDNRFRYISEPDKGVYDAYNKGWKMAYGKWIYYLGSDDTLTENGLYDLINKSENADIVFGKVKVIYPNGFSVIRNQSYPCLKPLKVPGHQSLITRRKCIELNGGFDEHYKIIADKDLTFQIFKQKGNFVESDVVVALFALGGASSNIVESYKENIYFCHKHNLGFFYILDISVNYMRRYVSWIYHNLFNH